MHALLRDLLWHDAGIYAIKCGRMVETRDSESRFYMPSFVCFTTHERANWDHNYRSARLIVPRLCLPKFERISRLVGAWVYQKGKEGYKMNALLLTLPPRWASSWRGICS